MLGERGSRRREEGRKVAGFSHRGLARSDAMAAALGGAGAGAVYIYIPSRPPEAKRGKGKGGFLRLIRRESLRPPDGCGTPQGDLEEKQPPISWVAGGKMFAPPAYGVYRRGSLAGEDRHVRLV